MSSAPAPPRRTRLGPEGRRRWAIPLAAGVVGVAGFVLFTSSDDPRTKGRPFFIAEGGWPLPRSADERDPFGRVAEPGDPWEVYATHLGPTEILVTTWRMRLPAVEREKAGPVTPEVFAAFAEPRAPGSRPIDRVWVALRAWDPIWRLSGLPVLRTRTRTLTLEPSADPWRLGGFVPEEDVWVDDSGAEGFVAGWTTPKEFAVVAAEGIVAIETGGLVHEVPEPVAGAFARLARRLPARDPD